ncbi:MAG: hypothetical protein LBN27_13510 [Prevotellaceae bacterium]|nr:hypothetical protein [Prevotellaceae bacterium]
MKKKSYLCGMKIAIGILSVYVMMLTVSFSPGIQLFESRSDCCHTEQHCCADMHHDDCTPHTNCSICSSTGFVVNEITCLQVKLQEISTEISEYTQPIYFSPYVKGILQPPRFV